MSAWISFEEIKKAVSLEMVIDHYRIELRRVSATSLRGKCPLPMHGSDKSRASFTATLTKGVGGVWACQSNSCIAARGGKRGGNALDLVATMEGCSIRDAAVKLAEWFAVPGAGQRGGQEERPKPAQLASEKQIGESEEKNKPLTFELQGIDHKHTYLESRGVAEGTACACGVGFFAGRGSMGGRVVFPIHNEKGELVAYAGRAIDGCEPRYKFPAGFHKSLELYNLHRLKGELSVIVVEGFFDCMHVTQAGYPCVSLMGCTMSKAQEHLIAENFAEVVLMLDGDAAGRVAAEAIADRLQRTVFSVKTVALPDGVQPDQLSTHQIRELLASYGLALSGAE